MKVNVLNSTSAHVCSVLAVVFWLEMKNLDFNWTYLSEGVCCLFCCHGLES